MFLRKPAHEGVGRGQADAALLRLVHAGQQPEQRGFAGTVGADHSNDVPGGNREGELGEERAVIMTARKFFGNKGCSH